MTLTRHENGAGATPTCGRRRRRGGGAQLYNVQRNGKKGTVKRKNTKQANMHRKHAS